LPAMSATAQLTAGYDGDGPGEFVDVGDRALQTAQVVTSGPELHVGLIVLAAPRIAQRPVERPVVVLPVPQRPQPVAKFFCPERTYDGRSCRAGIVRLGQEPELVLALAFLRPYAEVHGE